MILHRLVVSNWRSLLASVDLGEFSEFITVVHAPNGTGKSSVFEALRRALFDAHHVSGDEIAAVRPWGRELTPSVQVEFSQSGVRYRVTKTFLEGASAELSRLEGGKFQPLANSRNADAKVREIICASEAPGRGLSKQEHWGLSQVLWAPQGSLQLSSVSGSVTRDLRAALGVQLSGEGGSRLEELLDERYQTFFTKGGKPRVGKQAAPILALEAELVGITEERQQRLAQYQRFQETSRAVQDAHQRRNQARVEADALRDSVVQARQLTEAHGVLVGELELGRRNEKIARERFDSLSQTLEWILKARGEVERIQASIPVSRQSVALLESELKKVVDVVEVARLQRDASRFERRTLEARAMELEDAVAFHEENKARDALAARLEKLQLLDLELQQLKSQRAAVVAPESRVIKEVRKCVTECDQAQAALRASLIHLKVQPKDQAVVRRLSPDETHRLNPGEWTTISGSPAVRIEIEGFGIIEATGPEGDAMAHREALLEAERRLARLTQPYGTQDPERLQQLRDQAEALDQAIQRLVQKRLELLDGQTDSEWAGQLAEMAARLQKRVERYPEWQSSPPQVSAMKLALDQQRKAIERAIELAEDGFDKARVASQAIERQHGITEMELRNAVLNLETAQRRLAELTQDGQSDEARMLARQEALMAWEAAKVRVATCESRLREIPGDPRKTQQMLERQLNGLEQAEALARDEEKQAEGRLQTLGAEGAYSRLVACEERLADLRNRVERERLRMDAIRVLHETVQACKAQIVAAVAAPVERTATQMLDRIAGPRLGSVHLTEDFVPTGIRPQLSDESVSLTNLSGGEQEQLFLVIRLALGLVLARDERQLVVLDDVLNATDAGRLARVLGLLEESSERLQIVILTCHPERYRGLEAARFIDLKSLCQ